MMKEETNFPQAPDDSLLLSLRQKGKKKEGGGDGQKGRSLFKRKTPKQWKSRVGGIRQRNG